MPWIAAQAGGGGGHFWIDVNRILRVTRARQGLWQRWRNIVIGIGGCPTGKAYNIPFINTAGRVDGAGAC